MPRPKRFKRLVHSLRWLRWLRRTPMSSGWRLGTLLWVLAAQSPAWAADCDAVLLQPIKPLQFGAIGIGVKRRGWVVLDQNGGFAASNEVALLGKSPPSPGLARVTAPANSTVILRAVVSTYMDPGEGVALSAISLGYRARPLEKNADFWVLHMPDSALTTPIGVEVSIGALLNFKIGSGRIPAAQFLVSLECVGYQPR